MTTEQTIHVRRPSCRYHCRRCGRHFASLIAFDRHLGWFRREGREDVRVCEEPKRFRGLRVQSDDGVCRIPPDGGDGIVLWEEARRGAPRGIS